MRWLARLLPLLAAVMLAAPGCSSSTSDQQGGGEAAVDAEIRRVAAKDLPPLGDASPTSDPSVEASGPQGWKRLPRKDQYVIGWYGGSSPNILPRIFIRVEDWDGQASDTTLDNVVQLAAEIDQALQNRKDQVVEWPHAMDLGGEPWVRYVEDARLGKARAEKQILQRVVDRRLYTVELQIYIGKILESRDQAYAVAAGLQFRPAAESAAEQTPGEPSSDNSGSPPADASAEEAKSTENE